MFVFAYVSFRMITSLPMTVELLVQLPKNNAIVHTNVHGDISADVYAILIVSIEVCEG